MSAPQDPRARMGRLVDERRRAMSLSVSAAARAAGIDRGTWTGIERGTRDTEPYMFARIEKVLGWKLGSIDTILDGGDPVPELPEAREEPQLPADEAIIRVMRSTLIPEDHKKKIVAILIEDREREQRRRLALADDLIRSWSDAG